MNEQIQQVVDAVKQAAPVVWNAAYRQVYVDGIENIIVVAVFGLTSYFLAKLAKRVAVDEGYNGKADYSEPGPLLYVVLSVIAGLIVIPFLCCAIDCFLNPTFSAIKELASLAHR